jgi:NAD(P)-dependent dehydrogenase (short-subunit alcohol dehydrogenase family)
LPPRAAVSCWCPAAPPISTSRARRSRDATTSRFAPTRPISATAPTWHGAQLFPDVDILVNNAGAIPGGTLFDVDEARWRTAWDLKVLGTINMTRAFYPLMKARSGGAIINVIGNAARTHDPDYICGSPAMPG